MTDIRLIHLADIHLGYSGSKSLVFGEDEPNAGRYVREVDIEQAVKRLTKHIIEANPPVDIVVIAGDLFHSRVPSPRATAYAARMVSRLERHNIDVVIVDGNHDSPIRIHTGSPTTFLREFGGGVHIVNSTRYEAIHGGDWLNQRLSGRLAVHCLPYQAVLGADFSGATPHSGCSNVLLTHGRIGGMPDLNTLGLRAGNIPREVLRRGWDYVALGDWHIHRYRPLNDVRAYYAGSLEALNFKEAEAYPPRKSDDNAVRGAIDVRLRDGRDPVIESLINSERRRLLRLESIDADNMDADQLMDALRHRLDSGLPAEALVRLEVKNCSRAVWEKLDHGEVQRLRMQVCHCETQWSFVRPETGQSTQVASEATLDEQWHEFLGRMVEDEKERSQLLEEGLACIDAARQKLQHQRVGQGEE